MTAGRADGHRLETSAHASQTLAGMIPMRLQPSEDGAAEAVAGERLEARRAAIMPTSIQLIQAAPRKYATIAPTDSVAPMACANRFGGPGTSFGGHGSRGTITRVTSWPHGDSDGPVATRATNP